MHTFEMTPSLLRQYAMMTKNEVFLHLAIKALARDGKLLRNLNQICRLFHKNTQRMLDAEYRLKRRGLLRIHWVSDKRYWYVYDSPVGEEENALIPLPLRSESSQGGPAQIEVEAPKKPGLLKRLKSLMTGMDIDDLSLLPDDSYQKKGEV